MITIVQSDDDFPPVTIDMLVAAGVDRLVDFQASGGLHYTPRVKSARWLETVRMVLAVEHHVGHRLQGARDRLDAIRRDPWCEITVDWGDL